MRLLGKKKLTPPEASAHMQMVCDTMLLAAQKADELKQTLVDSDVRNRNALRAANHLSWHMRHLPEQFVGKTNTTCGSAGRCVMNRIVTSKKETIETAFNVITKWKGHAPNKKESRKTVSWKLH